ncbi:RagB/SusD family nutrient uptake outer membrane protein [Bacteroides ihuae]|uniref:RagB/SusD family nutrient uptake outer membrane protein n=1 Tax=Bacteroides ihuae TaxID=1852362 RepID=UPI0008D966B8|nr:RagB/SusD family nutrient uptake outer membrane protein [Bacteroides ihuae]
MKLYKKIFLILSLGMTVSSCLDLDPQDQLADGNLWKSANDFKYFANNFYGWTRDFGSSVYDGPHSDVRSDLMTYTSVNEYSHGSNSIPTSDANYTANYAHIRRTNLLLKNAASYAGSGSISRYVAEAKFFRAYCYFDLVQLYGNAIILKEPIDINSPEMNAQRNDRGDVIDFIIQDLQEAAPELPETVSTDDDGRLTRWAAYAFLSRVALYEGTWQKYRGDEARGKILATIAAEASKEVIDKGGFELFKPVALAEYAYKYLFTLENVQSNPANLTKADNKEYIFYRRHDETLSPIGKNITHNCLKNVQYINRKLANMYLCSDGLPIEKSLKFQQYAKMASEFQERDNRMKNTLLANGVMYWGNKDEECRIDWKGVSGEDKAHAKACDVRSGSGYQNQKWATERNVKDTYEGYDYPIIRYAEVLLNYAEAVYERDGKISDEDLNISLNLVRCRVNSDIPKLSNSFVQQYSLDMREEIRRERTVELFNEGFRVDDLKRWKTAEIEMPQDILGIKWAGTEFESAWGAAGSITKNEDGCLIMESGRTWSTKNYLYPLPADQLQLNPNLGQNSGWE